MVKYPSSAVEQTRESIYTSNNPLETILLLTCLVKNGMREDRKNQLISECVSCSKLTEEEIITLYEILNVDSIYGYKLNPEQRRLGCEPNGNYRHEEYLIGKALESILDVKLYRSETPSFDFSYRNENWELVGPVAPFYFDSRSFMNSLENHLCNKCGMDTLVACTITLSHEEQVEIKDFIEKSSENDFDILLLDQETLDTYVDGLQGYKFLSNLN
jgi:hypothetical protein